MNDSTQTRLQQLEMLYSEQEYTIQSLSETIARQDKEIARLEGDLQRLREQVQTMKTGITNEPGPVDEKPPHY